MNIFVDMMRAVIRPQSVMAKIKNQSETRALAYLMGGSSMAFLGGVGDVLNTVKTSSDIDFEALFWGRLFAMAFLVPLLLYAVSALSGVAMRYLGRPIKGLPMRLALAWSFFAIGPWMVVYGILIAQVGRSFTINMLGAVGFLCFLNMWVKSLIEASKP